MDTSFLNSILNPIAVIQWARTHAGHTVVASGKDAVALRLTEAYPDYTWKVNGKIQAETSRGVVHEFFSLPAAVRTACRYASGQMTLQEFATILLDVVCTFTPEANRPHRTQGYEAYMRGDLGPDPADRMSDAQLSEWMLGFEFGRMVKEYRLVYGEPDEF